MNKATIEIIKNDNGKLQYSFTSSGVGDIDQMANVAIGTMNMFAKSGGNIQNLMGSLGGNLKQQLGNALLSGLVK